MVAAVVVGDVFVVAVVVVGDVDVVAVVAVEVVVDVCVVVGTVNVKLYSYNILRHAKIIISDFLPMQWTV